MVFPSINGKNLLRQKIALPQDFIGKVNLVFVAFQQWQQQEVDTWGPVAGVLENQFEGLAYYELPTFQTSNIIYRMFINEGMRVGIPNHKSRERTVTLYLDKIEFRRALEMADEDHIYTLLVDRDGQVFHSTRGSYNPEAGERLRQELQKLLPR